MHRVKIDYRESCMELPDGESILGRGLACRIRFNDPSVSRNHARITVEASDVVIVEDLDSTNGTTVNTVAVKERRRLSHHDVVHLGNVWFRISIVEDEEESEETTLSGDLDDPNFPEEFHTPAGGSLAISAPQLENVAAPDFKKQTCPRCRADVSVDRSSCEKCGYEWPAGRPTSMTQRIDLRALRAAERKKGRERRRDVRVPVELPIIYHSDNLTVDATVSDLSSGGMFIATDFLDEIGTVCNVTVLPDGAPAITIAAKVCHVVASEAGEDGCPPGVGIEFTSINEEVAVWLGAQLKQVVPKRV